MLLHSLRAIKSTRKFNRPNSRKIFFEMVLAPKVAPKEGLQKLNGSLIVPLSTIELWGGIQQVLTLIERFQEHSRAHI